MTGFDLLEHCARTDVGVRRSHNQDAFGVSVATDAARWREHGHLFIVADGMGGHAVGEKAAAKAASDIPHLVSKYSHDGPADALRKAYAEANAGIHSIGQENPEFRGLGTTATTLWLRSEGVWLAHVGDSRAYRLRDGYLEQLTFDHSAVWEIARRQGIRPDQLHGVKSNVILRSLGPEATVEVDVEGPHPFHPGDTFLLCSDGLSGQLSDYEIGSILASLPAHEAAEFLIELANLRGGPDNVTVIVARLGGEPGPAASTTEQPAISPFAGLKKQWPLSALLLGIIVGIGALVLEAIKWPKIAMLMFSGATASVAAGLGGLIVQTRRQQAEDDLDDEPPPLRVYSRTRCVVETPLIEKLVQAEEAVREKLSESDRNEAITETQAQFTEAKTQQDAGDLASAFRSHCRVMHTLVRRFNRLRHKEEVFSPVWDKHG